MTSTGFENYAEALKIYLAKYREVSSPAFCFPSLALTHLSVSPSFLFICTSVNDINILTTINSPNHKEERPSRRDRAVATVLKGRSRVQLVRAPLGSRTHPAQQRTRDRKRVSTTSSVLMDRTPHSN